MAFLITEKPKQFTFIPSFYYADKEDLKQRIEAVKREVEPPSDDQYHPNIRGRMRSRHDALYGARVKPKKSFFSRWMLVVVYVGLVLAIIYMVIRILSIID